MWRMIATVVTGAAIWLGLIVFLTVGISALQDSAEDRLPEIVKGCR